ncbi:MAG TPA: hypothetical protein VG841_12895 [Caulobacterales bacterium]|nr:hypothetical protein [Caulobacterales bacterium]
MRLARGPSRFWAALYRAKLLRPTMPFWRVVVEAKLNRRARAWPRNLDGAVTAVFVWARTIEEAEGLAALALDEEGLDAATADAVKTTPAARPRRSPAAVARTELGFITRVRDYERSTPPPQPGARA